MATQCGSLLDFIQYCWTVASPGTVDIHWAVDWWDSRHPAMPQISVSNLVSPHFHSFNSGGSLTFKYKPLFLVNVWQQVPRGSSGTQELSNVEVMRREVCRVFRENFNGTASTNYAGSLNPFCVVLPQDYGTARHELIESPRMLRYEITLMSTRDNE